MRELLVRAEIARSGSQVSEPFDDREWHRSNPERVSQIAMPAIAPIDGLISITIDRNCQ
jgi:hypothetical protein